MGLREREADNVMSKRAKFPMEFALAEDTLDLAARIFSDRKVAPPGGDELVSRIALGLIPSSSQVREMAEACGLSRKGRAVCGPNPI